jgi:hypothetical protein
MRRTVIVAISTLLLVGGCARPVAAPAPTLSPIASPSPSPSPASATAQIYIAALRYHLHAPVAAPRGAPSASPPSVLTAIFILAKADPTVTDPMRRAGSGPGVPIAVADQQAIVAALADIARVTFVANRGEAIVNPPEGCARARDDGVFIALAPPIAKTGETHVGLHSFEACLSATWQTYVAKQGDDGWTITGTTGPMAIA